MQRFCQACLVRLCLCRPLRDSPLPLIHPKTGEPVDFIAFARTEGRFSKHFDKDGNPSATIIAARQERLENWRILQDLAGVK